MDRIRFRVPHARPSVRTRWTGDAALAGSAGAAVYRGRERADARTGIFRARSGNESPGLVRAEAAHAGIVGRLSGVPEGAS